MSHKFNGLKKKFAVVPLFMSATYTLGLSPESSVVQGIKASSFEGIWDCEVQGKDVGFTWEAKILMDGQWISGRTLVNGAHLSTDFWKVDLQGLHGFLGKKTGQALGQSVSRDVSKKREKIK